MWGFLGQMLHDIPISVARVSRKSSTIFLLNLCKIQRHMFIYLGFTSQRSLRSVQYILNQNFAHSTDLKGKIKSCAVYRILAHFKYCFYKRLLFDLWIFLEQNNDNVICNRIKLSFLRIYWFVNSDFCTHKLNTTATFVSAKAWVYTLINPEKRLCNPYNSNVPNF